MPELSLIQQIAIWLLPVLFAITHHEAAHAFVAYLLGDTTAKSLGRLSANPIRHIDLVGTILLPIAILLLSNFTFIFGWAKPVPINYSRFKHPRRDSALATAAGPVANLLMAILWAICLKIGIMLHPESSSVALFMVLTGKAGIIINLFLAFLNLIPIPPLDGSRIVSSLLPPKAAITYNKIEPYGFIILMVLMFLGILNFIVTPLISMAFVFIKYLFNL